MAHRAFLRPGGIDWKMAVVAVKVQRGAEGGQVARRPGLRMTPFTEIDLLVAGHAPVPVERNHHSMPPVFPKHRVIGGRLLLMAGRTIRLFVAKGADILVFVSVLELRVAPMFADPGGVVTLRFHLR